MEIIKNEDNQIIRFAAEPTIEWLEKKQPPTSSSLFCTIQRLTTNPASTSEITLTFEDLSRIVDIASRELAAMLDEWHNPKASCCYQRRARDEVSLVHIGDIAEFRCKVGYGCKKKEQQ